MKIRSCFVLPMFGVSLLGVFAGGCAHEQQNPPPAMAPVARTAPAPETKAPPAFNGSAVSISGDIMAACNIVINKVDSAPKFDLEQSSLLPQDREVLDQVAKCVTTGPLKGRSLQLTGRADARGETEYNFALGEHRAESVGSYLTQLGVAKSKIVATSRGKLDATGTDESSWARDRRVDIALM
ncbi:OmpA family protein [Pendulispora albinea]|uniref:OmpA family protein n=1 Tax=Pendulispora albinea TaxID=2741071 RepID=A0ABZ2M4J6_9BACT